MAPKRKPKNSDEKKKHGKHKSKSNDNEASTRSDNPAQTNIDPEAANINHPETPVELNPLTNKRDSIILGNIDPTVSAPIAMTTSRDLPTYTPLPAHPTTVTMTTKEPVLQKKTGSCKKSCGKECCDYIYNAKEKTFCERTCDSWMKIVCYSTMYLIFLLTFTMILLFTALSIIKANSDWDLTPEVLLKSPYVFARNSIGLHVTPMFEIDDAQIHFRRTDKCDYFKYINPIEDLLKPRENDITLLSSLGPCGKHPYGYGENPCVIVKIDDTQWHDEPLNLNSSLTPFAPEEVKTWMRSGAKILWLHCSGYSPYDRESIGKIVYYPYPPGFEASIFPLGSKDNLPLISVQFTKLTLDVPITVVCKLWHEQGPSSVYFTIHIESKKEGA